jgi:hypothetical protein
MTNLINETEHTDYKPVYQLPDDNGRCMRGFLTFSISEHSAQYRVQRQKHVHMTNTVLEKGKVQCLEYHGITEHACASLILIYTPYF